MKKIELSKRLHKASEFVVPNLPALDVGSDHAYLPIYLVQEELVPLAIAGEVVEGPFKNAKSTVSQYNLEETVLVRLGDGLDVLKPADEPGTVFICGMGGTLIASIIKDGLEKKKMPKKARLVLQPNNAEEDLRKVLAKANYKIIEEEILEEKGKIYELIVAEYTEELVEYSTDEYLFGPVLMKKQSDIFNKKWTKEKEKLKDILQKVEKTENREKIGHFKEKIQRIEQVIT